MYLRDPHRVFFADTENDLSSMKGSPCLGMDKQGTLRVDGDRQISVKISNWAELIPGEWRNQDQWWRAGSSMAPVEEAMSHRDPERTILLDRKTFPGEHGQF